MRRVMHGLILGTILASGLIGRAGAQSPAEVREIITEAAERHGVSAAWLVRVASCESTLRPWAVGRLGEQGLFQLLPSGLLRDFYARGFSDPFNAWESAEYAASAFARGLANHWSCR